MKRDRHGKFKRSRVRCIKDQKTPWHGIRNVEYLYREGTYGGYFTLVGEQPPYREYRLRGKKLNHSIVVQTLNQMENLIARPAR